MKRSVVLLLVLSLAAVLLTTAMASGQSSAVKAKPDQIAVKPKQKKDTRRPYKFKFSGTVEAPPRFCGAGKRPGKGATNCIPIRCGPGVKNPAYCAKPGLGQICSGKVRIIISRGKRIWGKRSGTIKLDCTYKFTVTLKKRVKRKTLRYGRLKVKTRFMGNAVLTPRSAKQLVVRGGKRKK